MHHCVEPGAAAQEQFLVPCSLRQALFNIQQSVSARSKKGRGGRTCSFWHVLLNIQQSQTGYASVCPLFETMHGLGSFITRFITPYIDILLHVGSEQAQWVVTEWGEE